MIDLITEGKAGCLMAIFKVMSPGDHQRGRSTVWRVDAGMLLAPREPKKARRVKKASRSGADEAPEEAVETVAPTNSWAGKKITVVSTTGGPR
jgi:hypothetical protein